MSDALYRAIFNVASVLEIPVVICAFLALALVILEGGGFVVEIWVRRRRNFSTLESAAGAARVALESGDHDAAAQALRPLAWNAPLRSAYGVLAAQSDAGDADIRIPKELADFDLGTQRRLGRTRLLVRLGPALGLMGTLIPLSPALDGLARGNVTALTHNLRIAFSVTVLGLFIGVVAFALSLVRERLYGQDYSDLEYVAATLTADAADGVGTR